MTVLAIYREPNQPVVEDHDAFVHVVGVGRFMVAIYTIFDDGIGEPGPVNYECVCPNFATAHAYITKRFNMLQMRCERLTDDLQSGYDLFFADEQVSSMVIHLELMRLETGDFNDT